MCRLLLAFDVAVSGHLVRFLVQVFVVCSSGWSSQHNTGSATHYTQSRQVIHCHVYLGKIHMIRCKCLQSNSISLFCWHTSEKWHRRILFSVPSVHVCVCVYSVSTEKLLIRNWYNLVGICVVMPPRSD